MKGPEFFGRNLTPKIKENLARDLSERRNRKPREDFEPPVDKIFSSTPEEKESIQFAINMVREELKRLSLGDQFNITENEIYLVSSPASFRGNYSAFSQQVLIAKEKAPGTVETSFEKIYSVVMSLLYKSREDLNLEKVALIVHELIHGESYQKFVMTNDNRQKKWSRVGYQIVREDGRKKVPILFEGLNEAVVEKTVMDILGQYLDNPVLSKIHDFLYKKQTRYKNSIILVEKIIKNIAKKKNCSEQEIWEQFKKNQFTGNMMFLRVIEDIYGKGSLRQLAEMGGYVNDSDPAFKLLFADQ